MVCAALVASAAGCVYGQQRNGTTLWTADSLAYERDLNELTVKGVRAPKNAPFAVSNVDYRALQTFSRTGQELPFLFARTPGIMAWSENGLGTGTTYMRMRGAADSRINVTLDGVSLNSPEDQCVFWANMNSYAAFLGSVQIQRGVGTSTNGDGAFGGTVALSTASPSLLPHLSLTGSYGSYNTYNAGLRFGTGLRWNHWTLDGAWNHTGTDGYIHGTKGNSGSYFANLTYQQGDGTLRVSLKNIGNYEKTGQAWSGVTAGNDDYSMNTYDGIRTYRDMYDAGLGRYNSLYESFNPDWAGGWTTSRYQMADGSLWPKTTDNFWQNRTLLGMAYKMSEHWSMAGTLHYAHGYGYYEEFRPQNKLSKFGLSNMTLSDGSTLKKDDFVRRKGLTQNTYGMTWHANYTSRLWDIVGGASFQNFEADHWGYLTYAANAELYRQILSAGRYKYYDSQADKCDQNLFAKAMLHITSHWDVFADLQYRHVSFQTGGINDKFYESGGSYYNQSLDIFKRYDFLNPKAGLTYHSGGHRAYASYAMSHREPERNNFTDNGSYPAPKAETLHDVEAGYEFTGRGWHAGAGLYYMRYHDQFVQTGQQSDIGENLTTNVKESYRMGVELTAGVEVTRWLSLEANAALSRNRITDFDEVVETYDGSWKKQAPTTVHYNHSTLAFSPSALLNGFADFHVGDFSATWHTGYVSRQYLDNTENKDRSLPAFTRTDIHLSYDWNISPRGLKHAIFGLDLGNIFNRRYASSGWVYSAIVGDDYPEANRYYQIGYVPMAGFTIMGNVTLKF